jgi:hypothetical protein
VEKGRRGGREIGLEGSEMGRGCEGERVQRGTRRRDREGGKERGFRGEREEETERVGRREGLEGNEEKRQRGCEGERV